MLVIFYFGPPVVTVEDVIEKDGKAKRNEKTGQIER